MQLSQVVTSSGVLMHVYSADRHPQQQQQHQQQQQQQQSQHGDFRVPQSPGVVSSSTGSGGPSSPAQQHHHQQQLQLQLQQQSPQRSSLPPPSSSSPTGAATATMRPPAAPGPRCKSTAIGGGSPAAVAPVPPSVPMAVPIKTEYSRSPPLLSEEPTSSIPDLGNYLVNYSCTALFSRRRM